MKLFNKKSKYAWLAMAVTASLLGSGYAVQAASTGHDTMVMRIVPIGKTREFLMVKGPIAISIHSRKIQ